MNVHIAAPTGAVGPSSSRCCHHPPAHNMHLRPSHRRRVTECKAVSGAPKVVITSPLKRNKLGGSNIEVTEVCLGTMTFGEQNTEAEGHAQLSYAAECGVNFIDTAEIYPVAPRAETSGATSTCIGNWLRHQRRDRFVVATKVAGRSSGALDWIPSARAKARAAAPAGSTSGNTHGNSSAAGGTAGAGSAPAASASAAAAPGTRVDAASIRAACEAELVRLRTDYIDLLQLHWPDRYVPGFGSHSYNLEQSQRDKDVASFEEQVSAIGQLIKEGKVRAWGLSNETSWGVMQQCLAADKLGVPRPVTVQNCYNLVHRNFDSELSEVCAPHNLNLGLLPWSALAGGALTGKYLGGVMPPGSRFSLFTQRYYRFNLPRVQDAVSEYVRIAREAGMTPAQLGYAFCRSRRFIPSTIVGATSLQQLAEGLTAFASPQPLPAEVLEKIQEVHVRRRNPVLLD